MDKAHDGKYDVKFRPELEPARAPQTALEAIYAQLNNAHSDLIGRSQPRSWREHPAMRKT